MQKKYFFSLILLSIIFITPVRAESQAFKERKEISEMRQNLKNETKEIKEEARENIQNLRKDFKEEVREKIATKVAEVKKLFGVRMELAKATVKAISGTVITVEKDGVVYAVNTGKFDKCTTQLRRKFWGKSDLSEFSVGNLVNISGRWANEQKTAVNACLIRNVSIQKRFGVFFGTVLTTSANGFTMSTVSGKRANQTVTVLTNTKLINRKEEAIVLSDIQVGHKVRVSGLWDNELNTVTEVTKVKDFTLPVILKPSPVATVSPAATPTP